MEWHTDHVRDGLQQIKRPEYLPDKQVDNVINRLLLASTKVTEP